MGSFMDYVNKHNPYNDEKVKFVESIRATSTSEIFLINARGGGSRTKEIVEVFREISGGPNLEDLRKQLLRINRFQASNNTYIMPQRLDLVEYDGHRFLFSRANCDNTCKRLKKMSPDDVALMGAAIARTMSICHRNNIFHRNIKPDNIFVSGNSYYLGGFKDCLFNGRAVMNGFTEMYYDPQYEFESKRGTPISAVLKMADIYALGMTMYAMLKPHKLPIDTTKSSKPSQKKLEEAKKKRNSGMPLEPIPGVPSKLMDIILRACSYAYSNRQKTADWLFNEILEYAKAEKKIKMVEYLTTIASSDMASLHTVSQQNGEILKQRLMEHTSFGKKYEIVNTIGSGGYGYVYRVSSKSNGSMEPDIAVKVIPYPLWSDDIVIDPKYLDAEIKTMKDFGYHRNIVKLLDSAILNDDGEDVRYPVLLDQSYYVLYMELLTPITRITMDEKAVIRMAIDICQALKVMHGLNGRKILHRDIKPQNILYSEAEDTFKLGDFGTVKETKESRVLGTQIGTEGFMAPEVYNGQSDYIPPDDLLDGTGVGGKKSVAKYGYKADIYSLGVSIYYLLNNNLLPYMRPNLTGSKNRDLTKKQYDPNRPPFERPDNISDGIWRIITKACEFDPDKRFADAEALEQSLRALL